MTELLAKWSWGGKAHVVSLPDAKDPSELHQRDPKGFPAAFQQALDTASLRYDGSPAQNVVPEPPATMQQPEQALDGLFTLQHLLDMPFVNPRWSIPDLLPEGLLLLVGKPKLGKSWLALQFAFAVAAPAATLDTYQASLGEVLYLALEDTPQRLQARSQQVLSTMGYATSGPHFRRAVASTRSRWPHPTGGICSSSSTPASDCDRYLVHAGPSDFVSFTLL